ncbi:MAG: BglG family transcription antiterminator [Bacteroidota bacterium]
MQEVTIQLRVKHILQRICSESDYITVTEVARGLGISSRTVLRELPAVEDWLAKKGCQLEKKAGVGIKVNGSREDRRQIMELLGEEKEERIYTPKERQTIICSELLQNQDPVKIYTFTRILNITEGTVCNDLDKVEEWLNRHSLTLVRKQGLGVYIAGEEADIRKAMISFIYENMNENCLLGLLGENITQQPVPVSNTELIARNRLLNLLNNDTLHQLEELVRRMEEDIGQKLADSAYVGLIVHLAIAIQRIIKNEDIVMNPRFMEELKRGKEYAAAAKLALGMGRLFGIRIPEDEIGYIAMHIKGTKNGVITGDAGHAMHTGHNVIEDEDLVKLANEIITVAEAETGKFLSQNENLLTGLVNHLGPALSRLRMNLEIRNPLYEDIRIHYPQLLALAGKCVAGVEQQVGMKIPEPEIGYIAMHLGAAIEKNEVPSKRIFRAVIACATGIGTSRLLATKIENEFENIHIIRVTSVLDIEESWLREQGIEFIIATVGIEKCGVPVVIVNPLLLEADKLIITRLLEQLKTTDTVQSQFRKKTLNLKDKMRELNYYGQAVTEVLDHFFVKENSKAENIDALISEVSRDLPLSAANRGKLEAALKEREAKGGTYIAERGILLLHCRTEAVDQLYFGVIKLGKDVLSTNLKEVKAGARIGIVIVAPENCNKYLLEAVSFVNGMIIDKPELISTLTNGVSEDALDELSNILDQFYKLKHHKYFLD